MDKSNEENTVSDLWNYHKYSGKSMVDTHTDSFGLQNNEELICNHCNNNQDSTNNYCKYCGSSLQDIVKIETQEVKKSSYELRSLINKINIKKSLLSSISSILIMSLIAVAITFLGTKDVGVLSQIINPVNIVLMMNAASISIQSSGMFSSEVINITLGIIVFFITTVGCISLSNVLILKNSNENIEDFVINNISSSLIYSTLLCIIAASSRFNTNYEGLLEFGINITADYSMLNIFTKSFIIYMIVSFMSNYKKEYSQNMYIDIFRKSIYVVVIGYVSVALISLLLYKTNNIYLNDIIKYTQGENIYLRLLQISVYLLLFGSFVPVGMSETLLSVVTINSSYFLLNTKLILYVVISIVSLILIVSSNNIIRKYRKDTKKAIKVFSISYAAVLGALASITQVSININNYLNMGASGIITFIISFIYCFIISNIVSKLINNEINEN